MVASFHSQKETQTEEITLFYFFKKLNTVCFEELVDERSFKY